MRRTVLTVLLVTCASLFGATAQAAAWNVPTNVRIVQKSNLDTSGRVYGTIQAAIDSIGAAATATNPFLVKVMPGVYDLGTASLRMKAFVDVEGSGPENTVITSSNNNVDGGTCTVGTVLMANNSAIRNIRLVNRAPALNGDYTTVAALVFNNVKARAEHLTIMTGSDTAIGGQNNGACTGGAAADATLNDVVIEARNGGAGQANAIMITGGRLTITHSRLYAFNKLDGYCDVINDNSPYLQPSTLLVEHSHIEGTCPSMTGLFAGDNVSTVSNSTFTLNVAPGGWASPFWATNKLTVTSSQVTTNTPNVGYWIGDPSGTKIAATQLPANVTQLAGAKLVGCYDESFQPIANQ